MQARVERVWGDALILGVLGYAALGAVLAIWNLVAGRHAFHSASAIGMTLFFGGVSAGPDAAIPAMFAANGVHLLIFLFFGAAVAWATYAAGQLPAGWYPLLVAYAFVFLHLLAASIVIGEPARSALPLPVVLTASLAATIAMGAYTAYTRPELLKNAADTAHEGNRT